MSKFLEIVISLTVILCLIECIVGKCKIPKSMRGRHLILDSNFDPIPGQELVIRSEEIEITQDGQTQALDCVDDDFYTLLLRTPGQTDALCLQFSHIMDVPAQYDVRRLNEGSSDGKLFTPSPVASDASMTILDQCTAPIYSDQHLFTRPAPSGCSFPPEIEKTWSYTSGPLSKAVYSGSRAKMTMRDGTTFSLECDKYDVDRNSVIRLAMRTSLGSRKDGVMCLILRPLSEGKFLSQLAQIGDRYNGLVRTIFLSEPIYLHETCDLMDTPIQGVTITSVP